VDPGAYYLFDTQTMKADFLRAARKWINATTMHPKEPFAMKARDGLLMHGYLTKPSGNGPYPMVVLPHGGPHGIRDEWEFDWEVQLLANRGYAVLQLNYRGSGGYGEAFEKAGYLEWGAKMQDDITDATKWAIDNKHADANRICIYGASYGGYAALMGAVREPTLYKCAIGYAGVYDLELMFSSGDTPRYKSGRDYLELALGKDKESLHARSPVYNADKIQVPVLLIHGKADWRAAYEQATRMKAALEKNKKQYEWMALGSEGHGVYDEESRQEVYARIVTFLDKYLKGEPAKTANATTQRP
jgi:dipeptidyl aminopeptidase/acylaminoacyl peptidase